jgi:RNA polymerase sigma-54 factor
MALEQKLRLKLAQRLVMTPSLQQAIKLLQLSRLELEDTLAEEILENPVLDVEDATEDASTTETEGAQAAGESAVGEVLEGEEPVPEVAPIDEPLPTAEEAYADIDVEAFFADYLGDGRDEGPSMAARGPDSDLRLENIVSASAGLYDHLLWQLHLLDCSPEMIEVCEFIIGNLDEDGFLCASDEEIIRGTDCSQRRVIAALALVRSLDPPGIAARTLQECLAAQIEQLMVDGAADNGKELLEKVHLVISDHWNDLLHQRWEALSNAVGFNELAEIKPVLEVIQGLEPKPGRIFRSERNQYIEPDVYVRSVDGNYTITLNDDGLPRLRINPRYSRMLQGKELDKTANEYIRDKMRAAMWLIKSIDQRQRTIYKVANSIVSFQKDFLDNGIEHLRPMVLRQVAEDIGMHESTISRVVSNKYMYTPRGLFPMKYFFHSGVDSARGENVSSMVVKERIRKVVEAEDPGRPLSDSKIMRMLQKEGIRLARRTVAKYREEMMIPASDKRKKVF